MRIYYLYPMAVLVTAVFTFVVVSWVVRNQPTGLSTTHREAGTIFNLKTTPAGDRWHYEYDVTFPDGTISHRGGTNDKIEVDPFR